MEKNGLSITSLEVLALINVGSLWMTIWNITKNYRGSPVSIWSRPESKTWIQDPRIKNENDVTYCE